MGIIYDLIFIIFALLYIPVFLFKGKKRQGLNLRLGMYPEELLTALKGRENIWVHAVSVGEVMAVSPLIERLRHRFPDKRIVITTVTETGNAVAKAKAKGDEIVLFLPFDISLIVKRVISHIRPSMLIITETEIWPNLIRQARRSEVPMVLVNGRISEGSFRRYSLVRVMLRPVLRKITAFFMQTESDREKIISLGADPSKVKVSGNMKFDNAVPVTASDEERHDLRNLLGLGMSDKLLVCGSTHPGEEEIIISCYANLKDRHKNLKLLVAPRHIERTAEVEKIVQNHGLVPICVSKIIQSTHGEIFLLDTIGGLKKFYSVADIVFVGGSLVKRGGQNMIEPAVFARPIVFGPHTFNFRDIASVFLSKDAAIMVKDNGSFKEALTRLLEDTELCNRLGENAKELVAANKGASDLTLAGIENLHAA